MKLGAQNLRWLLTIVTIHLLLLILLASLATAETVTPVTHKVQVSDPELIRTLETNGAQLIADYGSYRLYQTTQAFTNALIESRDHYNFIRLRTSDLDTRTDAVRAQRHSTTNFSGKQLHLIQFAGPPQPAWSDELTATGARIISYLPENAYLIYTDSATLTRVQSLADTAPHVQWEGPFRDDYKIHPRAQQTDLFEIQLVADASANTATLKLLDQLKLAPIKRKTQFLNYLNLIVPLDPKSLATIAAQPDVIAIIPFFPRQKFCERQDQIIAGNLSGNVPAGPGYLAWLTSVGFNTAQFTNFIVDLTDSGIDNGTPAPAHFGLYQNGDLTNASRIVYNRLQGSANSDSTLSGCDGHGTLNAHLISGYDDFSGFPFTDDEGYHYGLGICPFVSVGSSVIFDPTYYTYPDFNALQSQAYQSGARVSNNSWGSADSQGEYDGEAQRFDALVRDAQPAGSTYPTAGNQGMIIVFAVGNDGPNSQTVDTPGTAKNVITVGATENVQAFGAPDRAQFGDDQADNANDILTESGRGPCLDGRIKPDLMAPGTHISGGVMQAIADFVNYPDGIAGGCFTGSDVAGGPNSAFWPDGQQFYTAADGTSHAAPCVTGGAALVLQYFLNRGNALPSPAMAKAYLMNSARYLTGAYASDTLPSMNQGMGELNLGMAFDGIPRLLRDQRTNDLFTASGQTRVITGTVVNTNQPFRVTLAWTDAPGNLAGASYNNNLDLTVTVNSNTYKGNVFSGACSVTGGNADAKNNVESVFLPAGVSGNFTVTVAATSINSIGVPNSKNKNEQDFALVIYNAAPPPGNFSLTFTNGLPALTWNTATNYTYILQSAASLFPPAWTDLQSTAGTGKFMTFKDTNSVATTRYYRLITD